jgi:hypothetical protein
MMLALDDATGKVKPRARARRSTAKMPTKDRRRIAANVGEAAGVVAETVIGSVESMV